MCLDNIVTIKALCEPGETSTSGYDLMSAPEISPKSAAAIANEEYVSGLALLKAKLDSALLEVRNDFISALHTNNYVPNLLSETYTTGNWSAVINPVSNNSRGITIYKAGKSTIKKPRIKTIEIYPVSSAAGVPITIHDNGMEYIYNFNLVGGQVNVFNINHLIEGQFARIVMPNAAVQTYSGLITCKTGCNGSLPNPCGYVKGWNGTQEVQSESFGIGATFACECDLSSILCDLSRAYSGKLIWLKARSLVMEEAIFSTRLNSIVLYGKAQLEKLKPEVDAEYVETWNTLISSLPTLLKRYSSECITCTGIKKVTNV